MKSLKNFIPKRKYRERSQLEKRNKLGLLEKKKDYKERATDYHAKEQKMVNIKEKIRSKNQDEFYFAMNNSKLVVFP